MKLPSMVTAAGPAAPRAASAAGAYGPHAGIRPANGGGGSAEPTGKLCPDSTRYKDYKYSTPLEEKTFFGGTRKTQTIFCPCKDQLGAQFWGVITRSWTKEDDNTLSCPTQRTVRPHYTQPGQHPYEVRQCVAPSTFDRVIPDDGTGKPPKDL